MGNAGELLRMLEPAVRPGGIAGPTDAGKPREPFESKGFDVLLEEAKSTPAGDLSKPTEQTEAEPKRASLIGLLEGVDRIENGSLRGLVGGRNAPPQANAPASD